MPRTRMQDLPPKLVGEKILTKIPITSLREVRSTCRLWNNLSKEWILGKAASTRHQFLGFMTMNSKLRSLRCHLRNKNEVNEDLDDISIKNVDLFNQVEVSRVFHCDGLLLCALEDSSSLVLWNPYLGQTLWISPRISFHRFDRYAFGYDKENRNPKILRFVEDYDLGLKYDFGYEIYDLSSGSWRAFDFTPDFDIEYHHHGASLKGNPYFFAQERLRGKPFSKSKSFFLLCFDFTRERFGPRLTLPVHPHVEEVVALSCVRDEQLAVLYQSDTCAGEKPSDTFEIWVSTRIEPDAVSWMRFLKLDMGPVTCNGPLMLRYNAGSFFIDEEKKVVVVIDTCPELIHRAYIIGDHGYFKYVCLGGAHRKTERIDYIMPILVCSSPYLPSLVQISQPRKRKDKRRRKDKVSADQPTAQKERNRWFYN